MGKPVMTVALPMRNSKDISFLAFESLLNQQEVDFDWELIVYEENHDNMTPLHIIREYEERFKDTRCVRFVYLTCEEQPKLIDKWIEIANNASESSVSYLLQACDDYSYSYRLTNSYEVVNVCNYDWYDNHKALFYSFLTDDMILYNHQRRTNLSMALKTELMRKVKTCSLKKGIDGYIYTQVKKRTKGLFFEYHDDILHLDGLFTQGFNNISIKRQSFFNNVRLPFQKTHVKLKDLTIPNEIKRRINGL